MATAQMRGDHRAVTLRLRQAAACGLGAAAAITVAAVTASTAAAHAAASPRNAATSGWTRLHPRNGWFTAPFGNSAPAVRTISGIVYLKGAMATTATNPVPFTLPAAFRPAAVIDVKVDLCNAANGRLQIARNGTVLIEAEKGAFSNAACFTSLDGVSFAR